MKVCSGLFTPTHQFSLRPGRTFHVMYDDDDKNRKQIKGNICKRVWLKRFNRTGSLNCSKIRLNDDSPELFYYGFMFITVESCFQESQQTREFITHIFLMFSAMFFSSFFLLLLVFLHSFVIFFFSFFLWCVFFFLLFFAVPFISSLLSLRFLLLLLAFLCFAIESFSVI